MSPTHLTHQAIMDPLLSYNNVHSSSLQLLSSFIFKKSSSVASITNVNSIKSPSSIATHLLAATSNKPCTLPQHPQASTELSLLLQNKYGMIGPLQPSVPDVIEKKDPPAAEQPKRPAWTESHAYLRGKRSNAETLRILSAELNMIRASKITRSLRPRRTFSAKRQDEFVWGRSSSLRISNTPV